MGHVTFDFTGNKYVVTGATSGIGRKVALELSASGAMVLAIARNAEKLEKLAEISDHIVPVSLDICQFDEATAAISNFVKAYGKLDGLVNCAGLSSLIALRTMDIQTAQNIMQLNFFAAMHLTSVVLKKRHCNDGSSVVLISSVAAHKGVKGEFAYGASKAALIAAVKCFSKEITIHNHRINTISPGWIDNTNMTDKAKEGFTDVAFENVCEKYPLGLGKVEDIADMALYLLSDSARWITGTDFKVDGGYLA